MDLDIEHPATGEVDEDEEEEKGLVAVRRDDETSLTRLKLKPIEPSGIGGHYYLTIPGNLKIWQNENRTGEVTEETEFNPEIETTLYVEAIEKSISLNDQQIALNWKEGEKNISYGDWVKLTAVEAETEARINYWIREQWINMPWHLFANPNPFSPNIAGGDDREASLEPDSLEITSRVGQKIVINPFSELDADGLKDGSEEKFEGESTIYVKATSVPHPDQDYSANNRLLDNPQIWSSVPTDPNDMHADTQRINNRVVETQFHGTANDQAVWLSADIDWDFTLTIDASNPLEIQYSLEGWHDDYPAIELHLEDSLGPRFFGYEWLHPLPSDVWDLVNGQSIDITDKTGVVIP